MSGAGHERHRDDVGAYLIGALPELEAQVFERHLAHCPDYQAELEWLRVAVEALPATVESVSPPSTLKASLLRAVEREAREGSTDAAGAAEPERAPVAPTPPGQATRPAARRWRWTPRLAVAALGLLAAAAIAGFGLARVLDPEERTVAAEVDERLAPGARASLLIPEGRGPAVLAVRGMPDPGGDRVYQVWLLRGGRPVPGSKFDVSPEGNGSAGVGDDLEWVAAVLVTEEPAGGRRTPSSPPMVSVRL